MTATTERMRMIIKRRRGRGLRELRLVVPDTRLASVRKRVAAQTGRLVQRHENGRVVELFGKLASRYH